MYLLKRLSGTSLDKGRETYKYILVNLAILPIYKDSYKDKVYKVLAFE
jgi:hypothetical protein